MIISNNTISSFLVSSNKLTVWDFSAAWSLSCSLDTMKGFALGRSENKGFATLNGMKTVVLAQSDENKRNPGYQ